MDPLTFAATTILVTASGALAPGPLFFATITHGAKSGARSGFVFSVAHTMIEFALIMLFALGLLSLVNYGPVKLVVGVAGGIVLLFTGAMQIRDSFRLRTGGKEIPAPTSRNLLLVGLTFTGLNPFFILWWLTVGANLIFLALEFASFAGVFFMYLCHAWIDFAWLMIVAHLARIGANLVGSTTYRVVMAGFGVVLICFGLTFITGSLGLG